MPNVQEELRSAIDAVLQSDARKKLVIAGPGAGKTTLFRRLLETTPGGQDDRLVLTFINNLKADLEQSLGQLTQTYTLHGYCQSLLHRFDELRDGLPNDFVCYPGLVSFIRKDWAWLQNSEAPHFVELMRNLAASAEQEAFYRERSNYYGAVDFDDSVYRTLIRLRANREIIPAFELILIDEFQDFNRMEASVIELLAEHSRIVIAGDDDQALYSQLRGASWDHIRTHYAGGEYEVFNLPFCMRCPQVIVDAVADILQRARAALKLNGRIEKPYRFFEPVKGADSQRYPRIALIRASVQRQNANYFGKFIEQAIRAIPEAEIEEANGKGEPTALIIGSNPYRQQVEDYLTEVGLVTASDDSGLNDRQKALEILNNTPDSNLGWRILLACGRDTVARDRVRQANDRGVPLVDVTSREEREAVIREAAEWAASRAAEVEPAVAANAGPIIKVTSYEGAKGLSAQHVFLIGLHAGDIPRDANNIQDIEICRFLVGITRTKKKCSFLITSRFGEQFKQPSVFVDWINAGRYETVDVNAAYWRR